MAVRKGVWLKAGLISAPVSVETAVATETETQLNTLCNVGHPPARTRQDLKCPECGNKDRTTFVKGRENGSGQIVVVDTATLEAVKPDEALKNSMDLTAAPADEVGRTTIATGSSYYLVPMPGGEENYRLIARYVTEHPDVALLTVWVPRSKASLYRLGVFGNALTLTQLAWPEAVKVAPVGTIPDNDALYVMAEQFITSLSAPFDPATFVDTRRQLLADFLAQQQGTPGAAPIKPAVPQGPSLADQLAAALAAQSAPAPKKRAPRKKTA